MIKRKEQEKVFFCVKMVWKVGKKVSLYDSKNHPFGRRPSFNNQQVILLWGAMEEAAGWGVL